MIDHQNQENEKTEAPRAPEADPLSTSPEAAPECEQTAPAENAFSEDLTALAEEGATVPDVTGETADEETNPPQPPHEEPTVVYRWDYVEQRAADTAHARRDRRGGGWTFGIVMSLCFLVALGVLALSLGLGGFDTASPSVNGDTADDSWRDSFDYGNELDGEPEGALTLQEISARGNRVVVAISVKTALGAGSGTGIILTEDGYIATNAHVVDGATEVSVQTYDGDKYTAEVIGSSEIDDLAVLKIDATELPVAKFGNSTDVMVGDRDNTWPAVMMPLAWTLA